MHEKLDSFSWGNLKRLAEGGILAPGETILEREQVGLNTAPGLLLVTSERVLYFRASPLSDKEILVSLPFLDIEGIEVSERRSPIKKRGLLTIRSRAPGGASAVTFEYINGGKARAEHIARAIFREQNKASTRDG